MEPVDFAAIYRQNLANLAKQQNAAPQPAAGTEPEKLN